MTTTASWVPIPAGSPFPVSNLPYGSVSRALPGDGAAAQPARRELAVAIGDYALSLAALADAGLFDELPELPAADARAVLGAPTLNPFMSRGAAAWQAVRDRLTELLTDEQYRARVAPALLPAGGFVNHLAFEVGDYVDFYSSEQHARNLGQLFRPGTPPLTPNWKHLPIGYHGRSGTVVVSGTPVVRPNGQRRPAPDAEPIFGPSVRLDIEAEVGFVVGTPSPLGAPVGVDAFTEHVFGVVLVNDWTARDIQAFEYQPLGPFLGKSFATSVSPWVVPLAALRAARTAPPAQDPLPLPYLTERERYSYDLTIEVRLNDALVSRPPFAALYWTPAQQLAHLTVNGASLRTGDLYASGTVSGDERAQCGSLIELTWNGTEPITLPDGSTRTFLADGDTVTLTASAPGADGGMIGFGPVSGTVLPAAKP